MAKEAKSKRVKFIPNRATINGKKFVIDENGILCEGLSFDTGNGYYFFTDWKQQQDVKSGLKTRKDYTFGTDYRKAIEKFNNWKLSRSARHPIPVNFDSITDRIIDVNTPADVPAGTDLKISYDDEGNYEGAFAFQKQISETQFFQLVRHYLINDLQTLSDRVGIPALAKVKLADSLETRPLKLQVLLDFYLKNNPSVKDELKDVKASFLQFMQLVGKETVEEIRDADLYGYDDSLKRINEKRELPNSRYVNKRFARVRTVFNFYNNNFKRINKSDNPHEDCIVKVMKDFTAICVKLAEQIITQDPPKDFAPKIFKQMMQVEPDEMYKLIYCLTLACGFYAKDIEGLTKSMIKTKNDIVYIDYPREKTKRVHNRLIVLPQIVADKLTAYIASDKTESDFIFKNQQKANLKRQSIWDHFDLLRKTITHDDGTEISFKHLRDTTASTLAFAVTNVNFINITIGHRAVKSEYWKYIRTNQEQLKEVPKIMYEKFKDGFDLL